ncbi:MAG: hypothetical protein HFACDABA_01120 [Anaerolineales bacterium]|nr:hypothetical protein [Anaerolineales bacterium]
MKIIRNEKLIERNGKIGRYTSLAALLCLAGGMILSFNRPDLLTWSLIALLAGFTLTQISMFFGNRFGRKPRPDEQLDAALKGIPGDYTLFHYSTPVSHLLVGPAGLWILLPFNLKGKVTYHKNRWRSSGGGFLQGYMRLFGQETIGRPDVEAKSEAAALEKYFKKKMDEGETPAPTYAVLVFLDPDIEIEAEGAPAPAIPAKKLKEFIRQMAKDHPLPPLELEKLKSLLAKDRTYA